MVRRRQWLTRDAFLDFLGATNLIPGPNSTELAIHIGQARAGWRGLLVAGMAFILPAALIVTLLAAAYVRYGTLPIAAGLMYGIKPVVIAIVVLAIMRLGQAALKSRLLWLVAAASLAATLAGIHELVVLLGAGLLSILLSRSGRGLSLALLEFPVLSAAGTAVSSEPFTLLSLFLVLLKIGSVLFGSGYVLLVFLRADLVDRLGWLTNQQLLDAIAAGQVTPGPVFTTATFIGYLLAGLPGALVATIGIFLPAFIFVALSHRLLPRLRQSATFAALLDGVNVGSLALMLLVTVHLGTVSLIDPLTIALAAAALIASIRYRVNSAWLVLAGAVIGLLRFTQS